jgi:hypothetical protein
VNTKANCHCNRIGRPPARGFSSIEQPPSVDCAWIGRWAASASEELILPVNLMCSGFLASLMHGAREGISVRGYLHLALISAFLGQRTKPAQLKGGRPSALSSFTGLTSAVGGCDHSSSGLSIARNQHRSGSIKLPFLDIGAHRSYC